MKKVGKSIFYEDSQEVKQEPNNGIVEARNVILVTEAEYLGHLKVLTEAYIKPLTPMLSDIESQQLFGNIDSVIKSSERLVEELSMTWTSNDMYNVVVEAAATYLHEYVQYCSGLPTALSLLERLLNEREEFRDKVCESEGNVRGIGLQSCLLKPFQRLTRLPLLFEPLKSAGEPVMPAISAITKLVEECNNSVEEVSSSPSNSNNENSSCRRSSSFYVDL
ncbi:rho guanine nucleotide exchange factor 16 isoform X1 [Halyomorpha halys]|uniref:rho guanine nucleotide exchange factor 16 isoform X1 n=1 Tax=Halyomorpha halys TaxID=286706 RepID=UPI0006D510CB|nr:rho guanine nucleotide exchange factor 16-like isoform X1 [Halyomorpha halys]XP_024214351.1 rho guanine nucleotide exchange factor 16-like isoform X1 [Halyomorpha halys]XP_024214352.1 rho guanine nucleotide exchange factor 16-like isoform X1 [Halyomorpha halys]XP_024214353.1 rho guanine nucleotide exchange factor 16-like isoform X1 [Halyomorpha halys]XP_024214354.1 rho guanine nucleotide exchange factor 16-like isoform X1 [Halyomorpha halys]